MISVSKSKNKSSGRTSSSGTSTSRSEQKRRVSTADEVRRLPKDQQIVLMEGENPALAQRIRYYSDPRFVSLPPPQSEVFSAISNLSVRFPIDDDTGTIETKLRRLILIHQETEPQPTGIEDENRPNEKSTTRRTSKQKRVHPKTIRERIIRSRCFRFIVLVLKLVAVKPVRSDSVFQLLHLKTTNTFNSLMGS